MYEKIGNVNVENEHCAGSSLDLYQMSETIEMKNTGKVQAASDT